MELNVLTDTGYIYVTYGVVERVNSTTIKAQEYDNIEDTKKDLSKFLILYNFNKRAKGKI